MIHPVNAAQVLQRLAPVHRGLFEDYVANVWCATHPLVKWKQLLSQAALVRGCAACTLAAALPACAHQVLRPSRRGFLYCLLSTSLAFFLFSYQVHYFSWLTRCALLRCTSLASLCMSIADMRLLAAMSRSRAKVVQAETLYC
jgi:alpha-1,3-glucosyltransferase